MRKGKENSKSITTIPKVKHITKTNHRTGYHKPIKNPTTNAAPDGHKAFCKRCLVYNGGCPLTKAPFPTKDCTI